MKAMEAPPSPCARATRPQWVSGVSLHMIDALTTLHLQPDHNCNLARTMTWSVQRSLTVDSLCQAKVDDEEIGNCLETTQGTLPYLQGAYTVLKRWYLHTSAQQIHPSRADLENLSGNYAALYCRDNPSPLGHPFHTYVNRSQIKYVVLTEAEVETTVFQMVCNMAGGPHAPVGR